MKYLPSALGVFLLLLAQTLFAAQPSFEDASPFLTNQTFYLFTSDLSATNFGEILSEIKAGAKILFPRMMAEPSVQIYVDKFDQLENDYAEWQKAALKISDGFMYTTGGRDGICQIVPVKNADPQAEKALIKSWNDIQGASCELLDSLAKQGARKDEDAANVYRNQYTITRTENAIVCFSPFANLQIPNTEYETAPETLEEYLKNTALRPDFAAGFEKARFGKVSTVFLALSAALREAMLEAADDFTPPEDFPLTKEAITDLANSATCIVGTADSFYQFNTVQVVFDSKKGAKKGLSAFRKFSSRLKNDVREDLSAPELALDLINYFVPALTPSQNDSILTFDFSAIQEKIAAPVKTFWDDLKRFQARQREKFRVDAKAEADRQYEIVKPWVTEGTFLVSRLDLERVTPSQWFEAVKGAAEKLLPLTLVQIFQDDDFVQAREGFDAADAFFSQMKTRGAKEAYILADSSNVLIPARVFLPGVTIKKDVDPEKGAALLAEDLFGDSETLKDLCPLIDRRLVFGQLKDAVVIFPRISVDTPSDACWESFISTLNPAENPDLRDGLELNAQCGLSIILNMNPMLAEIVKQGIKGMNGEGKVFSVPSSQFIMDGLNVIALGADPNLGLFEFNVLSKSPKAAKKMMKLLSLWKQEIFSKIEKDPNPDFQSPIMKAYLLDFVDFFVSLAIPVRDENRLYWDINQNERWNYLREHVPAPVLKAGGVGILVGLFLPAVSQARAAAREMQVGNNYKMLALAMLNHESMFGAFPPAYTVDENGKPLHSWRVLILPFLEQNSLYQQIRLDEPWDSEWNSQFHDQCPKVYQSVFNPDPSKAVIGVVVGEKTVFPPVTRKGQRGIRIAEIQDGTYNTILLVPCKPVCWMDPTGDPRIGQLQSVIEVEYDGAPGTIPAAFCDGSVQRISLLIDETIWRNLLMRSDGQNVPRVWEK